MNHERQHFVPPSETPKPVEKPPTLDELKASFEEAQAGLEKTRAHLRAAQGQGGDKETMNWLAGRLNKGESLDELAAKTAANVAGQREAVFEKELAYLEARLPQLEQKLDPEIAAIIEKPDLLEVLRDVLRAEMRGEALPDPRGWARRLGKDKKHEEDVARYDLAKRSLSDLAKRSLETRRTRVEGLDEIGRKLDAAGEVVQIRTRIEEVKGQMIKTSN